MTTYEVKMGVPLPGIRSANGAPKGAFRLALEALPLGGMIEVEDTASNRNLASIVRKKSQRTLTVRKVSDGRLGIWRTA
jgi:hypothetical protein